MKKLNNIEVCELGELKVMAIKGRNIIDTGRECIELANLLQVAVRLYFNNKQILIFTNSTIEDVLALSFEGINRNYFPDFVINEKYIVECKPKNLWNSVDVLSKKEAGIKYAKENNLVYKITDISKLTSKEVKELVDTKQIKFINRYKIKYENKYKKKS